MLLSKFPSSLAALVLGLSTWSASVAAAASLDTLIFGDSSSESAHSLSTNSTEIIAGQLGQTARRCLPLNPADVNGGDLTFTMAVDPVRRNYVSLKLWGGDDTDYQMGRLYLYVPLNGVNYQVGYRHEGDYMPLSVTHWHPPLPGRFFYSTTLLPLWMTQGKTSLTLKIVSTGRLYPFGSGGPTASSPYQYAMDRPSRGIYRAYTHVDPYLDVSGETQGTAPATTVRTSPGEETMAPGGTFFTGVNNRITDRLNTAVSVTNFTTRDVAYLARSYSVAGLTGYQNQAVVDKVVALLDAFATNYYATPSSAQSDWGGAFGALGQGVFFLKDQLTSAILDATINYGTGGTKTRRAAWGDMLYASREFGRLNDRRTLTNQTILANESIYYANAGLLVLGDNRAFPENVAQRYIKEACGLLPWLGNDLPDSNGNGLPDDGSAMPYGSQYYQVTSKGLTREWGFLGAGYGELAYHVAEWYRISGNTAFRDQAAKMARARAAFRRPAIEVSGSSNYRSMEVIGLLAWRGAHESDGNFAGYIGYADTADTNEGGKGMLVAAATGDPSLIGYAKQMLADNQFFPHLPGYYNSLEALDSFADYQTVKAAADSGIRLPMTDGQPDFAWADEQDRILALKQGNNRLWVTTYWQAKAGTGINGVARFHYSTATYDQYGVLETTPLFQTSRIFTRPNMIDKPEATIYTPPDNPSNAYAGERLPLGAMPADATADDPFRGKADFYAFRFGRYLVGLNAHASNSYTLKTPAGFTSATDLMSGATLSGTVTVAPQSTVVLDLVSTNDPAPVPSSPLVLTASGNSTPAIALSWSAASGAETYTIRRSTTQGGPYTALAAGTGLTATTFTDTDITPGTTYYYVVDAVNSNGSSYDSMEATTSAGVPSPWTDTDIGTVGQAGSASFFNESFVVSGAGKDIGGTSDAFHYTSLPVTGDGTMIARVASRTLSGSGADKIGLMIRESTATGSKYFTLMIDTAYGDQARMSYRASTGASAQYPANGAYMTFPCWLKVQRAGSTFSAYTSTDGSNWTLVGQATLSMNSTAAFGMFVCSRNTSLLSQATFDNVYIPGYWTPLPSAPASLSGSTTSGSVGLTWSASAYATSYEVKRSTTPGGPYTVIASGLTTTSFTDTTALPGWTYFYVVSAINSRGESQNSTSITITAPTAFASWLKFDETTGTTAADSSGNSNVGTLVNSPTWIGGEIGNALNLDGTSNYASLPNNITANLHDFTVTAWIYWNGGANWQRIFDFGAGTGSYMFLTPKNASTGKLRFAITTTGGSGEQKIDGTAALATSGWHHVAITLAGSTGTLYVDGQQVGQNTAMTLRPSDLGTTTQNWIGRSQYSADPYFSGHIDDVRILAGALGGSEIAALAAPMHVTGLSASGGSQQIALSWNPTAGATSYSIRRTTTSGGPYTTAASGVTATSFTDTSLGDGVTYYYVVTPANASGEGANSSEIAVATIPAAPNSVTATAGNGQVSLSWSASTGATGYDVLRATSPGGTYTTVATGVTGTSYTDATVSSGTTYYYVVAARDTSGSSANSTQVTAQTPPAAPTGLAATADNAQVSLLWNSSTGAATYNLLRSTTSGSGYVTAASGLTGTSYTDTGLTNGTTYYYVVTATNTGGTSANSSETSATPAALPSPWSTSDVGATGATGNASRSPSGVFTITGAGADIWGSSDAFRYVYQTATGDCDITARVTGVSNTNVWAKAGVMIRETLATGSTHAMVVVTPGSGVAFQRRTATNGSSASTAVSGITAPEWVRITRAGNVFTAYYSADGTNWTTMGSVTITMSTSVYIGLPVCSHVSGTLCTATIDYVTVNP